MPSIRQKNLDSPRRCIKEPWVIAKAVERRHISVLQNNLWPGSREARPLVVNALTDPNCMQTALKAGPMAR